jgi:hypothetical protein
MFCTAFVSDEIIKDAGGRIKWNKTILFSESIRFSPRTKPCEQFGTS